MQYNHLYLLKRTNTLLLWVAVVILLFINLPCLGVNINETSIQRGYDSLYNLTFSFENTNNDTVILSAKKDLLTANLDNNSIKQLEALILIIYSEIISSEYVSAIAHCKVADSIALKKKKIDKHIDVIMYSGIIYQYMGFTSKAVEFLLKAKMIAQTEQCLIRLDDINYYLGSVFQDLGEISKSRDYLLMSIGNSNNNTNIKRNLKSYNLLSNLYTNIDSIQKYLMLVENIIEENPDLKYEKVVLLNNQALVNKTLGHSTLAQKQYEEAINISKTNRFFDHLANLYNNYAYLLMAKSKYSNASIVLGKALKIAKDIKSNDLQASIYDSYCDYFTNIHDYSTALAYKDSSVTKRDQFRMQQQIQKSLFLSVVFETEQKEKELLKKENKIFHLWILALVVFASLVVFISLAIYLRQKLFLSKLRLETVEKGRRLEIADALIIGQDTERKRLAMDLHDGLSARLGALKFLVDGFFKSNEKYDDVSNYIKNIHQNVRELSHRMIPSQLEDIGLVKSIYNMTFSINKTNKFTIDFETNIEKRLSGILEINIYYLIYELVNNATKHSNGSTIFVQLFEHDDGIRISVEDNGGGFVYTESNTGMGLKNIKARIEYLGGSIFIDSNDSETIFMIEIPISVADGTQR